MRISRLFAGLAAATLAALAACSNDKTEPGPVTVTSLVATPVGTNTIRLAWTGVASEGYEIERAEGTATAFALVHTIDALSAGGAQQYDDAGLTVDQTYYYRITTTRGTNRSAASSNATATACAACVDITGDIATSRTLSKDTVYKLKGFIHVLNGATLTIQAGTTIRGDYATIGSSLMIMRGAQIQAVGTAVAPIVFTSSRLPGQRAPGDWGGLLLVGNALNNRSGTVLVEGTGTDGATVVSGKNYNVQYNGGNTATDNSGTLAYVRVEFAGYAPVQDQEFNAFTFAAVGSGTKASYLESLAPLDDAFEFFGGGFDIDHLLALETADDMFDMSEGWQGRMQFLIGMSTNQLTPRTGAGFYSVDIEGIENDGCNGSGCDLGFNSTPLTIPLVANFTLIGCGKVQCVGPSGGHGMMLRRGTGGYYMNGVVSRWPVDGISLRDPETYARGGSTTTPSTSADLQVKNILFTELPANLLFQAVSATQFALDSTANGLKVSTAATTTFFTKIPAVGATPTSMSDFDFTPVAGTAITTGGTGAFTGAPLTKGGTVVVGTAYQGGAAPGVAGWWLGWTYYARQ